MSRETISFKTKRSDAGVKPTPTPASKRWRPPIHRVAAGHFLDAPVARLPRLLLSPLFTSRPWKAALFNTVSI